MFQSRSKAVPDVWPGLTDSSSDPDRPGERPDLRCADPEPGQPGSRQVQTNRRGTFWAFSHHWLIWLGRADWAATKPGDMKAAPAHNNNNNINNTITTNISLHTKYIQHMHRTDFKQNLILNIQNHISKQKICIIKYKTVQVNIFSYLSIAQIFSISGGGQVGREGAWSCA